MCWTFPRTFLQALKAGCNFSYPLILTLLKKQWSLQQLEVQIYTILSFFPLKHSLCFWKAPVDKSGEWSLLSSLRTNLSY